MLNLIIAILILPPLCAIAVLKGNFDNNQLHWLHRMTATGVGPVSYTHLTLPTILLV